MILHVVAPAAALARRDQGITDMLDDKIKEGGGARGRVEDERVRIRQTHGPVELLLQNVVDGPDDVGNHGLRCVVNATALAQPGVIGGQEGLIEMDDGVRLGVTLAKIFQDGRHVGTGKQVGDVIHGPGDAVIEGGAGDLVEQVPQERISLR